MRTFFSWIALKDSLQCGDVKNLRFSQDYLYKYTTEWFCHFARVLFSRNFANAKFRENKVLAKISEFTVSYYLFEPGYVYVFVETVKIQMKCREYATACSLSRQKWLSDAVIWTRKIFDPWIFTLDKPYLTVSAFPLVCKGLKMGVHWLSGRVFDLRPRGRGFEPNWHHCVVSFSKNINSN